MPKTTHTLLFFFLFQIFPAAIFPQSILSGPHFIHNFRETDSPIFSEQKATHDDSALISDEAGSYEQSIKIALNDYREKKFAEVISNLAGQKIQKKTEGDKDFLEELRILILLDSYLQLGEYQAAEKLGKFSMENFEYNPLVLFGYNYALNNLNRPLEYTELINGLTITDLENSFPGRGKIMRIMLFHYAVEQKEFNRAIDFLSDDEGLVNADFMGELNKIAEKINDVGVLNHLIKRSKKAINSVEFRIRKAGILLKNKMEEQAEEEIKVLKSMDRALLSASQRIKISFLETYPARVKGTKPYKIGVLLPFGNQKNLAYYVSESLKGLMLANEEQKNNAKPVFEFVFGDTEARPETTVQEVVRLIEEELVIGIIGPLAKHSSQAAFKKAAEYGVPVISLSQSEDIAKNYQNSYRLNSSAQEEATALADYAIDYLGSEYFAVLYPDTPKGIEKSVRFLERVEDKGGNIIAYEKITENISDLRFVFRRLTDNYRFLRSVDDQEIDTKAISSKSRRIDAIYIPAGISDLKYLSDFITAYSLEHAHILTGDDVTREQLYLLQNRKNIITASNIFDGENFKNFYNAYWRDYHGIGYSLPPNRYSFYSYLAAKLFFRVIQKGNAITSTDLKNSLNSLKNERIERFTLNFDEERDIKIPMSILANKGDFSAPLFR